MRLSTLTTCLASIVSIATAKLTSDVTKRGIGYNWGDQKTRGVNLGGWLVLEPFITPTIFGTYYSEDQPVVDEWTLCEKLGKEGCYEVLKSHWDSWVTLDDFKKIRDAGFNIVRIPIGYWAYLDAGGPYTTGAAPYLDKVLTWARETGLKVTIDLHGAPRSQNGFDHSGHKKGRPEWGTYDSIAQTHQVLQTIESKYATEEYEDVIAAIEVLNEPYLNMLDSNMVLQFYRDAHTNLRKISNTPLMLHDGFWPGWLHGVLSPSDGGHNVVEDHHEYQIFDSTLLRLPPSAHNALVCSSAEKWSADHDKWLVVGEWSAALTDCAPHLNGFNTYSRYEGKFPGSWYVGSCAGKSGRVSSWEQQWKDDVKGYIETQIEAYEKWGDGWVFWNFKTEGEAGEWDLFQLLDEGVFPRLEEGRGLEGRCG